MREILGRAFNAAIVLLSHGMLAALLIAIFEGIERLFGYAGQGREILVFDAFPLRYLFQALDVGMIALFGVMGFKEAYEVMK